MSQRFDAATKYLVEQNPRDWLKLLGLPDGPVDVLDTDLATVSAEADRLIRVNAPLPVGPYVSHLEFQSRRDKTLSGRTLRYNVSAYVETGLQVESGIVLLSASADDPQLTGHLSVPGIDGRANVEFRYHVLRVWKEPVETFLNAGKGTLPLAPLAKVRKRDVPRVITQMRQRLEAEGIVGAEAATFWTATFVLLGLRFDEVFAKQLLEGVREMKESTTYQAILLEGREEGRVEAFRGTLLRQGTKRYGIPSDALRTRLNAITEASRLEMLVDRLFEVESWEELLG